jgi:hypothetical protein
VVPELELELLNDPLAQPNNDIAIHAAAPRGATV